MKLAYSWLADFVELNNDIKQYSDAMTMSGSKVEGVHCPAQNAKGLVVGRIERIERHPDADKLFVCTVDVGRTLTIVTGADNLTAGDIVPVVTDGGVLPDGKVITAGKLRGITSEGMLCSIGELGFTENDFPECPADGIMVLPSELGAKPGDNVIPLLGLDDCTVEFEITPNRPDCLSVRALARESAVTFNKDFKDTTFTERLYEGDVHNMLSAQIKTELCGRYMAAVVKNVRIKPSPLWLRHRLRMCGIRPINNIVDITNYITLLHGQPMHAFDYRFVNDASITVRNANSGETIVTLDGVTRTLGEDMAVIADTKGAIAIAGVMGGEHSGIYDDTTTIVFESACFNGPSVRTTAKQLGMRTESSARYEKGLSDENTLSGLFAALDLIEQLDCGEVVSGIIDVYPSKREPAAIPFDPQNINALIGTDISRERMVEILTQLDFKVEGDTVTPPYMRRDVTLMCDLAEEVVRIHGYNNLPTTPLSGAGSARPSVRHYFDNSLKQALVGYGLYENESFSFYSPKHFDMLKLPSDSVTRDAIVIQNPLGDDTSIMRTTAVPSMLEVLGRNYSARAAKCGIFEFATEYIKSEGDNSKELPSEPKKIIVGLYGKGEDFFTVKGIVEGLLGVAKIKNVTTKAVQDVSYLHTGRAADMFIGGDKVATVGEVNSDVARAYGIKTRCYVADIALDVLFRHSGGTVQFKPITKYPYLQRDICLVADVGLSHGELSQTIADAAGETLRTLELFDVFESDKLGAGKRSLAYSLTLQSEHSTLTDKQADDTIKSVLAAVLPLGAVIREG